MCGIAGFATKNGPRISEEVLRSTLNALEHRGPDDHGFYSHSAHEHYAGRDTTRHLPNADLLLIHRRLSILDLTSAGWQPMSSSDGDLVVVFNGEIYNYVELRQELGRKGHTFRSTSDTEVLLAAYAEWGVQALQRFVGMFAFVIFDRRTNRLLLARDFFGIKPLYFGKTNDRFGFASEIKPLVDHLDISRRVNPTRLFYYLRFGMSDHGEETLFADVRQVPSAHYVWINLSDLSIEEPVRYWQIEPIADDELPFDEAVTTVREMFLRNVELHMRSDVPLGAALSGGIDSSAIVAAMRHVGGPAAQLHLFSYVPEDESISEEKWIDCAAKASGGILHKVRASSATLSSELSDVMRHHGEPTATGSIYAQHHVFRAAREEGITVMLDGQGADEILGGYRHYFGARLASMVRRRQLRKAYSFLNEISKFSDVSKWSALLNMADHMLPGQLQQPLRRLIGKDVTPDWLNDRWFRDRGVQFTPVKYTTEKDVLHSCLARAIQERGLAHLLRYEDRNSMAFSVESRVPFLTPDLVTFVLSLPEEYLISDTGTSKYVFREAMRGLVPDAILDRRDKVGFETPEQAWIASQAEWVQHELESETSHSIQALNHEYTRSDSPHGRRGMNVWRSLSLIEWTRQMQIDYS
jgi:asparagine synthase (glutamine-hydrolysing)